MRFITPLMLSLLAALSLLSILQPCHGYRALPSYQQPDLRERQIYSSRSQSKNHLNDEPTFPKLGSDVFDFTLGDPFEESRNHEDNDSLIASEEGRPPAAGPRMSKRRKGPTLSVVNPLEILRQRLMLDLARRRIHENQQQIVANAQLLENIGKRAAHD